MMRNREGYEDDLAIRECIARDIREAYIFERRIFNESRYGQQSEYRPGVRFDGGEDRDGREFKPIWPKVADFVLDNGLEAVSFVRSQFYDRRLPPQPNQLLSEKALHRYERYHGAAREKVVQALSSQQYRADLEFWAKVQFCGRTEEDAWFDVLLDQSIELSALFRYCKAVELGKNDDAMKYVVRRYRAPAAFQYLRYRSEYDDVWADFIPIKFKARAGRILKKYIAQTRK